jgi:hypothetical protein
MKRADPAYTLVHQILGIGNSQSARRGFIDVAGSAHLFQGEAVLIADLCKRLKDEGITAQAALADTAGCAWALGARARRRLARRADHRMRSLACQQRR